uniref:Cytochrome P450 n=1 Tax=Oryza punctata TaxID=4537 RepID=A0A0E0LQE6_ORYPU
MQYNIEPRLTALLVIRMMLLLFKGQEIVTEDDIADMVYLKAVIKETLRLHPPVPLYIPDLSREDCSLDGYMILQEHNAEIDFKGQDFHFLPFGSGRRMCPGIHSATVTLEIMLSNLMYCFNWKLPAGMKEEDIDMTEEHQKEKLILVPQIA